MISEQGLELIKRFEGFSAEAYPDAAGFPTIGYGHLIRKGERFEGAISEEIAEDLLVKDVASAERSLKSLVTVALRQEQIDALVSFIFNLGGAAFQRSTLRRKINRGEYQDAGGEFGRWVFAGGRRLKGLERRRAAEAELFDLGTAIAQGKVLRFSPSKEQEHGRFSLSSIFRNRA